MRPQSGDKANPFNGRSLSNPEDSLIQEIAPTSTGQIFESALALSEQLQASGALTEGGQEPLVESLAARHAQPKCVVALALIILAHTVAPPALVAITPVLYFYIEAECTWYIFKYFVLKRDPTMPPLNKVL